MSNKKNLGQVYTPPYIVKNMIDLIGYSTDLDILNKYIIDNSCGNGVFLKEIVKIYCNKYIETNKTISGLSNNLQNYIFGIEIDKTAYNECILNLNNVIKEYGIENVNWNIYNKDITECEFLYNKMDYVIGNPPYIRIHNIKSNIKDISNFCKKGMTDMYLLFFDIGFRMLNKTGKLSYITPNSFLTSKAGINFREYIFKNKNLSKIVDFEHIQLFNATTYNIITVFDSLHKSNTFKYYKYNKDANEPEFEANISLKDAKINNEIYLASQKDLTFLKKILTCKKDTIKVKNGLATLSDSIFFRNDNFPFDDYVVNAFKISKEKNQKAFYPYDKNGSPIDLETLFKNNQVKNFLLSNKEMLLKRNKVDNTNWFLYGRTQGLKDMNKEKVVINTIIKDIDSIKLNKLDKNTICYSGLYFTDVDFEQIKNIIKSKNFIRYIKLLKKYKANGYYTFSSKDLEKYINFFYKQIDK